MLAGGAALAAAGCSSSGSSARPRYPPPPPPVPDAEPATVAPDPGGGPPLELGEIPPPRPGSPHLVSSAPPGTRQIALTVDDGYCGPCIARYVEFARTSGVHLTFNPNGAFNQLWTTEIVEDVREMVADEQVQIGNHTWSHANLLPLSVSAIEKEITRNEAWIEQTFGVTARPYFRPPYGYYDRRVLQVAAGLGYTSILLWNGTLGDATAESPQQIIALAEKWLRPGTIMLGHMNHPAVFSCLGQIQEIIGSRGLEPLTLDEMFGTSRVLGA
ncbi:MAG TPA: polysaccharide deacetylase family protein [Acidimicrobiales bacterium]|nr:polysaccharide deacetylase family protein [Acidimicrobiales bacterium]